MNNKHRSKPIPIALLVIYQKGYKFKYNKYYLHQGRNQIGSHSSCIVQPPFTQRIPPKACIINITQQLATIEAVEAQTLFISTNMKKKKNNVLVEVNEGIRYVIEMQKDFSICGLKAIMQVLETDELYNVKGVHNQLLFESRRQRLEDNDGNSERTQKMDESQNDNEPFQATLVIDNDDEVECTLPIYDDNYSPTLRIEDQQIDGAFNPTIVIDQKDTKVMKKDFMDKFQKKEIQGRRIKQNNIEHRSSQRSQISMPQTIRQNEMPETIQQNQPMPQTIQQNQEMPQTIQENEQMPRTIQENEQILMRNKRKLMKSTPIYQQKTNKNYSHKSQGRYYSTYPNYEKEQVSNKKIQDFDDLFENLQASNGTKKLNSLSLSLKSSQLNNDKQKEINPIPQNKNQQPQNASTKQKVLRKCFILQKKLTPLDKIKIKEKGYDILEEGDDFELLLINGELKLTQILLQSLLDGKQIESFAWINNPSSKITGKLEGFPWESIYKRRGKKNTIFNEASNYYLQQSLRGEFQEIMIKAGANLTTNLSKNRAKVEISIIIDSKSKNGKEIYEEKKNYKKWKFYDRKMILESLLMGQEIAEKYRIDSYSF